MSSDVAQTGHVGTLTRAYGGAFGPVLFKQQASDFKVVEQLGFEPDGQGEHLFLWVRLTDQNTAFAARQIARQYGVGQAEVSFSGLKDRRAETWQWFSVHLPGQADGPLPGEIAPGIEVLTQCRHSRKLRRGVHRANRFEIVLRAVPVSQQTGIDARLSEVARGFPNYFGSQRFGHAEGNLAAAQSYLAKPRKLSREQRDRHLSTLRAWVFNRWLSERVAKSTWRTYLDGDLVMLAGARSFFLPTQWDAALQQRLQSGDISIGGLLPGEGDLPISGARLQEYQLAVGENSAMLRFFQAQRTQWMARPATVVPGALNAVWKRDENSLGENLLTLQFELPAGSYATSLLREVVQLAVEP